MHRLARRRLGWGGGGLFRRVFLRALQGGGWEWGSFGPRPRMTRQASRTTAGETLASMPEWTWIMVAKSRRAGSSTQRGNRRELGEGDAIGGRTHGGYGSWAIASGVGVIAFRKKDSTQRVPRNGRLRHRS